MSTPYAGLPESEKESGREEADKIIAILDEHLDEKLESVISRQGELLAELTKSLTYVVPIVVATHHRLKNVEEKLERLAKAHSKELKELKDKEDLELQRSQGM